MDQVSSRYLHRRDVDCAPNSFCPMGGHPQLRLHGAGGVNSMSLSSALQKIDAAHAALKMPLKALG